MPLRCEILEKLPCFPLPCPSVILLLYLMWPACLAAEESCQPRSASDLLLWQHLFCSRRWRTAGAAASGRRRTGSGDTFAKGVALFEVVSGAWRRTGVILTDRESQPLVRGSQEPNSGSGATDPTADWKVIVGTLQSDSRWVTQQRQWPCQLCQQCVSVHAMCCDAVMDHMWYYALYFFSRMRIDTNF